MLYSSSSLAYNYTYLLCIIDMLLEFQQHVHLLSPAGYALTYIAFSTRRKETRQVGLRLRSSHYIVIIIVIIIINIIIIIIMFRGKEMLTQRLKPVLPDGLDQLSHKEIQFEIYSVEQLHGD